MACFTVEIGSSPLFCNTPHNKLKGTASITTNKPLKICTMLGGIFQPKMFVSVCWSAINVSEEPDCSKAAQKNITKNETIYSTKMRCVSILVSDLSVRINTARLIPAAYING